jgi:hypothetical protein
MYSKSDMSGCVSTFLCLTRIRVICPTRKLCWEKHKPTFGAGSQSELDVRSKNSSLFFALLTLPSLQDFSSGSCTRLWSSYKTWLLFSLIHFNSKSASIVTLLSCCSYLVDKLTQLPQQDSSSDRSGRHRICQHRHTSALVVQSLERNLIVLDVAHDSPLVEEGNSLQVQQDVGFASKSVKLINWLRGNIFIVFSDISHMIVELSASSLIQVNWTKKFRCERNVDFPCL